MDMLRSTCMRLQHTTRAASAPAGQCLTHARNAKAILIIYVHINSVIPFQIQYFEQHTQVAAVACTHKSGAVNCVHTNAAVTVQRLA